MIEGREIDANPLFQKMGLDTNGVHPFVETPKMYPFKENGDIRQNWSYFMSFGLLALKQKIQDEDSQPPKTMGIVGIGNGIEGVAAAKIFPESLRELHVVDTDSEILTGALTNIRRNVDRTRLKIVGHVGSFAEPLIQKDIKLDLLTGNVPNLPSDEDQTLVTGADRGTFMPRALVEAYAPPEKFVRWALSTQYAYLKSAAQAVKEGGSVLTLVGGRFPLALTDQLFQETGYQDTHEVISGYKEQTEAEPDFRGYSAFEGAFGVSFDFYPHAWAEEELRSNKIGNPTKIHNAVKIKALLQSQRVSAQQALEQFHTGSAFGHTVHLFRGVK